ncbi:MAG: hypothetical protein WA131_04880 [Desulfitobacteriaceae bacterium]
MAGDIAMAVGSAFGLFLTDRRGAANDTFFSAFDLGIGLGSALGWIVVRSNMFKSNCRLKYIKLKLTKN